MTGDDPSPGDAESRLDRLAPGSRLAGYRIESRIGAGGMAVVFKAREEALRRTVALKVLVPALGMDSEFRERFIRESRAATAPDHPHIIPIYAAGDADGVLYIAMRYISGGDLRALIRREGALPADRAASLLSPLASALDAGHAIGLVHRDVKPANVLIDTKPGRPDHPYLSDYGLAKSTESTEITATGEFLGTVEYCAPEQMAGKDVGPAADQYSLACVAYTMLTGAVPFPRAEPTAAMWAHAYDPPPALTAQRPDLPPATNQVLSRAMAKKPRDRYPTCEHFINDLRTALGISNHDTPRPVPPRPGPVPVLGPPAAPQPQTMPDPPTPVLPSPLPAPPPLSAPQSSAAEALPSAGDRVPPDPAPAQRKPDPLTRKHGPRDSRPANQQMVTPQSEGPAVSARRTASHQVKETPKPQRRRVSLAITAAVVVALGGTVAGWLLQNHGNSPAAILQEPDGSDPQVVAFMSNGDLVTADLNGAYLWNLGTGKPTRTVTGPPGAFSSVALNADGSMLATIGINSDFSIWNPRTGSPLRIAGPTSIENSVSGASISNGGLSSNGVLAFPGFLLPTSTSVWDPLTGHFNSLNSPDQVDVSSVAVSPDGSTVASSDGSGMTYLWDDSKSTSTPSATLASPDDAAVTCSGFSGNGQRLITGDDSDKAYVWDVATRTTTHVPIATLQDPGGEAMTAVALSPDGTLAATADSAANAIYVWNVASSSLITTLSDPNGETAVALAFSPNESELAVADSTGSTYVWRINP